MTTWQEGQGIPYGGYYNGNVKLMMANGTYGFYRAALLSKAKEGKLVNVGDPKKRIADSMEKIALWDKEWEGIPEEDRKSRMEKVIADVTPRMVTFHTVKGPMQRVWSEPDENNNAKQLNKKTKPKLRKLQPPSGSIAAVQAANPMIATPA